MIEVSFCTEQQLVETVTLFREHPVYRKRHWIAQFSIFIYTFSHFFCTHAALFGIFTALENCPCAEITSYIYTIGLVFSIGLIFAPYFDYDLLLRKGM